MSGPTPSMAPGQPTFVPVEPSSGLWERLTQWASENKTVVYTIAGVGIAVTGAGVIYYLNDNVCPAIFKFDDVVAADNSRPNLAALYRTMSQPININIG